MTYQAFYLHPTPTPLNQTYTCTERCFLYFCLYRNPVQRFLLDAVHSLEILFSFLYSNQNSQHHLLLLLDQTNSGINMTQLSFKWNENNLLIDLAAISIILFFFLWSVMSMACKYWSAQVLHIHVNVYMEQINCENYFLTYFKD